MSTQLKMYGILALAGVGFYGYTELDKSMNYVETEAYISELSVDCFIKDSNSEVVEKATNKLAYMDCELAPLVAPMHDHDVSDIQRRYQMEYVYVSPVDGKRHTKSVTRTSHQEGKFKKDMNIMILAHKEQADKSLLD